MYDSLVFDFETLDDTPNAVILDLAAIAFNIEEDNSFEELVKDESRLFYVKFDVQEQVQKYRRKISQDTLDWWSKQGEAAKKILTPSSEDESLHDALRAFKGFISLVTNDQTKGYVRGQSFDFPILRTLMDQTFPSDKHQNFPVKFWNQRDVRTAMAWGLMDPISGNTKCPLPKGLFEGFVAHNSIHDCARDAISLQHALAYQRGIKVVPEEFVLY